MIPIDSQQFLRSVKSLKDFPSVFMFVGDEETLMAESLNCLKKAFEVCYGNQSPDFNMESFYAEQDEVEKVLESCMTLPFLSEKRLVVLRHLEKCPESSLKKLTAYSQSPNPSTCLVFLWNAKPNETTLKKELPSLIAQTGMVVKCWKLYDDRRVQWVQEKISRSGKLISSEALRFLVREGGESLNELASEIEKLILFVGAREEITAQDAKESIGFRKNHSAWDFIESLGKGENQKAGRILENCLEHGEDPVLFLNLIAKSYRKQVCERRGLAGFNELKKADLLLKSGHGPESGILERLVVQFTD